MNVELPNEDTKRQMKLLQELNNLRAVGDTLQSDASRLSAAILRLELEDVGYEAHMAALSARRAVEDWTEIRRKSA